MQRAIQLWGSMLCSTNCHKLLASAAGVRLPSIHTGHPMQRKSRSLWLTWGGAWTPTRSGARAHSWAASSCPPVPAAPGPPSPRARAQASRCPAAA